MALTKTFGNDVRHYEPWLLILCSMFMGILAIVHIIQCGHKYTSPRLHILLALCLIFLCAQYVLATQDINASHLTVIANTFSVVANIGLFSIYCGLRGQFHNNFWMMASCIVTTAWLLLFTASSILILPEAIYIDFSFTPFDNDCEGCTLTNAMLTCWHITLCIAIAANLSQVCFAIGLQFCLDSKKREDKQLDIVPPTYEDKQEIRLKLFYLFLLSLSTALNNFGILFDEPFLDIIPYLLAQLIVIPVYMSMVKLNRRIEEKEEKEKLQPQQPQEELLQQEELLLLQLIQRQQRLQQLQQQQQQEEEELLQLLQQRQPLLLQHEQLQLQENQLIQLLRQRQQQQQKQQQKQLLLQKQEELLQLLQEQRRQLLQRRNTH
jgi:hypothetical protein